MKSSALLKLTGSALLGAALLVGCTTQAPSNVSVHEVLLYGSAQDHIAWVYGSLSGAKSSLSIGGKTVELRSQIADPLATTGSLSVDGKTIFKSKTGSLLPLASIVQQGNSYTISAVQDINATYLVSNGAWYKLSGVLAAGSKVQAGPQPVNGLQGVGQLTDDEANLLSKALARQGTFSVTVLNPEQAPDAALSVEPAASETRRTALYLQPLSVVTSVTTTTTSEGTGGTMNTDGPTVKFREVASGSNAQASSTQISLARTQQALGELWNTAYGRQVPIPTTPIIAGQTAVGIFLGGRATGGYGVTVQSVKANGSVLDITVNLRSPKSGSITTQSLTSPWTIVAVQGQFDSATVRDQNGEVLVENR